jgi:hypothetical protein
MTIDQWVELFSKFGLPVVGLGGAAYFLARHVWPFIKGQIEEAQAARKAEIDKFVDTIRQYNVLLAESQRENLRALDAITKELTAIRETMRSTGHYDRSRH